jgi:hypothetical protein
MSLRSLIWWGLGSVAVLVIVGWLVIGAHQ